MKYQIYFSIAVAYNVVHISLLPKIILITFADAFKCKALPFHIETMHFIY